MPIPEAPDLESSSTPNYLALSIAAMDLEVGGDSPWGGKQMLVALESSNQWLTCGADVPSSAPSNPKLPEASGFQESAGKYLKII